MKAYNILCRAVHLANVLKSTHNGGNRDISIRCRNGRMPRPKEYKDDKFSIGILQEKTQNLINMAQSDTGFGPEYGKTDSQRVPQGFPAELLHVENTNYNKKKAAENVTVEVIAKLIVDLEQARFRINEQEDVIEHKNQTIDKLKDVRLNDGHHALNQLRNYYYDLFHNLRKDVSLEMKKSTLKDKITKKFDDIKGSFPDQPLAIISNQIVVHH